VNRLPVALIAALALLLAACSEDTSPTNGPAGSPVESPADEPAISPADGPVTVTLIAYDSFPAADSTLNAALVAFTAQTGIGVRLAISGDAGTMVSKAVLTAGNPEGDVMWGVDNTLLTRAVDAFEPYVSAELGAIDPALTELVPNGELTPVDFGDVCLNFDIAWFAAEGLDPPQTFEDLVDPRFRDLLVVENPGTSSPGLAFLLATVAHFGADGWQEYWAELRGNGVEVVDSWTTAYYESFSGSSGAGPRPLVVSYASSPAAEVIFADPPRVDAPTGVVIDTCFRQVEFAGVLRGTEHPAEARRLIDFLAGEQFQREIALNLFVWPARTDVHPPPEFVRFTGVPATPLTVAPSEIDANREQWLDEWTQIVLR
jgi:thiamine transport system substrate-binding protein